MPDQPADPLHYDMKIPPEKPTSESKDESDQPNTENQANEKNNAGGGDKPETRRP